MGGIPGERYDQHKTCEDKLHKIPREQADYVLHTGAEYLADADLAAAQLGEERGKPQQAHTGYENSEDGEGCHKGACAVFGAVELVVGFVEEGVVEGLLWCEAVPFLADEVELLRGVAGRELYGYEPAAAAFDAEDERVDGVLEGSEVIVFYDTYDLTCTAALSIDDEGCSYGVFEPELAGGGFVDEVGQAVVGGVFGESLRPVASWRPSTSM